MSITKKDVEHVARLARIALSDEEKERFTGQLAHIIEYVDQLAQADIAKVEPMAQPVPLTNVFRKDEAHKSGLEDKILANAPERMDRFFKVRKVIE